MYFWSVVPLQFGKVIPFPCSSQSTFVLNHRGCCQGLCLSHQPPPLSPPAPQPPQNGDASGGRPGFNPCVGQAHHRPPDGLFARGAGTGCPFPAFGLGRAGWGGGGLVPLPPCWPKRPLCSLGSEGGRSPRSHPCSPGDGGPARGDGAARAPRLYQPPLSAPAAILPAAAAPSPRQGAARRAAPAPQRPARRRTGRNPPCRTRWRRPRLPLSRCRGPARRRRRWRAGARAVPGRTGRRRRRSSGARRTAPTWPGGRTSSAATASTATSLWPSAGGGPGRPASTGRTAPSWPPPPSTSRRCSRGASRSRARAAWSCRSGTRRAAPTPTRWRPSSASCTPAPSASAPATSTRCWRWPTGERGPAPGGLAATGLAATGPQHHPCSFVLQVSADPVKRVLWRVSEEETQPLQLRCGAQLSPHVFLESAGPQSSGYDQEKLPQSYPR